jgi:ribose transport system permease protein
MLIAAAEIDLSIGATAGLASVVTAMTIGDIGLWPAVLAGLGAGTLHVHAAAEVGTLGDRHAR